jgi:acetolactate synthase-1/2/3 large subunit
MDVLLTSEEEDTTVFPTRSRTKARVHGDPEYIERAAELLRSSSRPVIMAGSAIWWDDSGETVERLADALHAPIYVNGMARGCIDAKNPLHLSLTRGRALGQADVILVAGAEFDFRLGYGESDHINGAAKVIQINIDSAEIGHNRSADIGIIGDTRAVIEGLCKALGSPGSTSGRDEWLKILAADEKSKLDETAPYLQSDDIPIHPARLCREIDEFLDDDAVIIGDGGDIVSMGARIIRPRAPGQWLDPGPLGCLGMGAPFGLAAAIARPDKQILLLYGDGSFGFNGMEMDTAVRFNLPMVAVIGNDGGWGQMRLDAQAMGIDESQLAATELGFTRYEKMVEAFGGFGAYVEAPSEIRPALDRAFSSGRPACVNVRIDPNGSRQVLAPARGMSG